MRVLFIGTGDIGLPVLGALLDSSEHRVVGVVTQPDKPSGRSMTLTPSPVKVLASSRFVPIFQPDRIRNEAAANQIRYLGADVIVVMAYGQILPRAVLDAAPLACLNLHASLLPRHRGAAPIQAVIQAGDSESGITVMHMAEGLDTGDILLQRKITLRRRETGGSLHERLSQAAVPALFEALRLLKLGSAPRIVQDDGLATWSSKLTRESGRIDWSWTREAIDAKIRAMNPWPGAFTTLSLSSGGLKKLKVFSTIRSGRKGALGEVLAADRHGILVACAQGALLLREVQIEGGKRLQAREFHLGHRLEPGAILGLQ